MFSKNHQNRSDHSKNGDETSFRGADSSASFEDNLQPIDMSVFDREEPAPHASLGNTGDAQPVGQRIDMAAVAALNTSQFLASAVNAAVEPARDEPDEPAEADPFAPKTADPGAGADTGFDESPAAENGPDQGTFAGDAAPLLGETAVQPAVVPAADTGAVEESDAGEADMALDTLVAAQTPSDSGVTTAEEPVSGAAAYSRENKNYEHRRGWKALSTPKKTAIIVVIILALVLGIAGGAALAFWQNAREAAQVDDSIKEALEPVEETIDPYWLLILGSDSRAQATDRARSDVIMLCRIDPEKPQVTMVSIPRDTKVEIEGYGTQKINAAYALGGAKLAIKTIGNYAGVKISHYAEIYFSGLEDLVDQLGGVTVNVPEYCSYSDVTLQPGKQKLTGHEALIFARCRKTYSQGDFTRTKCQRILVEALVSKVLEQPATAYPGILEKATKCFSTDIPLDDLVVLATKMQGMGKGSFYSAMCPSTTGMVDGVSYTFSYVNQWKLLMQRADAGENPKLSKTEQEICGLASTKSVELDMKEGLPSDVQTKLDDYAAEKKAKEAAKKQEELSAQGASAHAENAQTESTEAASAQISN